MKQKNLFLIVCLISLAIVLAGCSFRQPERSPGQKQNNSPQPKGEEKIPEELKGIKSSLEQLFSQLEQKKELQDNPQKLEQMVAQKNGEQKEEKQNEQQGGENEQSQEKQQKSSQGGQEQSKEQKSPLKDWSKEDQQVIDLHQKWNGFEPIAVKTGIEQSDLNSFKEQLDQLTVTIKSRNIQDSLLAVNGAYKFIPSFIEFYEQENPPDLYRVKYQLNEIIFNAEGGNWELSENETNALEEIWPKLRVKLRSKDADLAEKFEFAIKDLKRTVGKQNKELVKIKGKIAMDNLKEMENKLKESSRGGQQEGQQEGSRQ